VDFLTILLLLLAGCVTGFLAGFFGVGGGILLVPVLLFFYTSVLNPPVSSVVVTHLTFGTSLLVVIFASVVSAYQYSRNDHVIWKGVLYIGLASVAGAVFGSTIASSLQGKVLQQIFATVVAVAAVRLLMRSRKPSEEPKPNLSPAGLTGIGGIVGMVSSLAGVGGGVFSIPMMYYIMKFPLKKALGTSSATIVITAVAATAGYIVNGWNHPDMTAYRSFTIGYVDYLHAIPIIIGTIPLARYGAGVAHKTKVGVLQKVYGVFLLVIAVKMFFF
jgi:uncharacterized membrane protein YfcA